MLYTPIFIQCEYIISFTETEMNNLLIWHNISKILSFKILPKKLYVIQALKKKHSNNMSTVRQSLKYLNKKCIFCGLIKNKKIKC